MTSTAPRLSRTELRELFLFADLTDTQLDWVRDHGDIVPVSNGEVVVREGEPARCFYVLLSGTIRMTRLVSGEEVEITRTDQLGAYFGAVQFYLGDQVDQIYSASVRALSDGTVLALPAASSVRCSTTGTRWRCTCCRACSSAWPIPTPWSGNANGCWLWASCPQG
jgi:CRP-like cAMP-binding protein